MIEVSYSETLVLFPLTSSLLLEVNKSSISKSYSPLPSIPVFESQNEKEITQPTKENKKMGIQIPPKLSSSQNIPNIRPQLTELIASKPVTPEP